MAANRKPGDVVAASPSSLAAATANENRELPRPGCCYTGRVITYQGDDRYEVEIEEPQARLGGVAVVTPFFGGMLGVNIRSRIPPGTSVRIVYDRESYIFAAGPEPLSSSDNGRALYAVSKNDLRAVQDDTSNFPADMLDGEVDLTNSFGCGMRFLATLTKMTAGDRAAVEVSLTNYMVRVLSEQFRHYSSLGEELIYHASGRACGETWWGATRSEILNRLSDELFDKSGDVPDYQSLKADHYDAQGRFRFLELVGWVGDFVHDFVTDPPATMVKLSEGQSGAQAGKSMLQRNSDGSVIINSVGDILIERTTRIPVPYRKLMFDDLQALKKRASNIGGHPMWNHVKAGEAGPHSLAHQIRQYNRWLSRHHAFARLLALREEWEVQTESQSPVPDWSSAFVERAASVYFESYSCIAIYRDGSVLLQDGTGNAVSMSPGLLQLSSTQDIEIEAANNIKLIAGNSVVIKAKRHIDLYAVKGKVTAFGRAAVKFMSEKGSVWIRSDASRQVQPEDVEDDPTLTPEIVDNAGVYIDVTKSGTLTRTRVKQEFNIEGNTGDREGDELTDPSLDFLVTSRNGATRLLTRSILAKFAGRSVMETSGELLMKGRKLWMDFRTSRLAKDVVIASSQLNVARLAVDYIKANEKIEGPKRRGPIVDKDSKVVVGAHYNHIHELDEKIELLKDDHVDDEGSIRPVLAQAARGWGVTAQWESQSAGPGWNFLPRGYLTTNAQSLVRSNSQSFLQHDAPLVLSETYTDWNWSQDRVGGGLRLGPERLMYGASSKWSFAGDQAPSLYEPSPLPAGDHPNSSGWTTTQVVFKVLA